MNRIVASGIRQRCAIVRHINAPRGRNKRKNAPARSAYAAQTNAPEKRAPSPTHAQRAANVVVIENRTDGREKRQ